MLIARAIADGPKLESRLDHLQQELADRNMGLASASMLDHCGHVVEIAVAGDDGLALAEAIDAALDSPDRLIAHDTIQVPRLFVSDMDSTMIGQECIDELADFAGLKEKVARITEAAMRGELDFESALRERVGLLAGLPESAISDCLEQRITPTHGARALVSALKDAGAHCVLVTGGFHHFADSIGEQLGFDRVVGNRLAVENGVLTGELAWPISDGATKRNVLVEELDRIGEGARALAMGDGANDAPMLREADYAFAFQGKNAAKEAANGRIEGPDLRVALDLLMQAD